MKLGPAPRAVLAAALLFAAALDGCGYRSALSDAPRAARLAVVAAPFSTPHPEAAVEALNGAREELARAGALGSAAYPRLVIEVLRVDELPAAIAAALGGSPLGRGSDIGVTARGWVEEREGGPPLRDSGDVRRVETVIQSADALPSSISVGDAIRSAARQAGRGVALRALGFSEPSLEPM